MPCSMDGETTFWEMASNSNISRRAKHPDSSAQDLRSQLSHEVGIILIEYKEPGVFGARL